MKTWQMLLAAVVMTLISIVVANRIINAVWPAIRDFLTANGVRGL